MSITVNGGDKAVKTAQSVAKNQCDPHQKCAFWYRIANDNISFRSESDNEQTRFTAAPV
ncbi:hypothetical protein N5923_01750 [Erwiniaceae bacterium BAC15a-03b]|uniref:Uncharacterized protein n=1 Tax=Winslowiella arboricola TaxID=2978220 RepID=A0A9J6PIC0_9GAMM|nr:hypothetical protein [Winslowiella arboricola]MCU5772355.1 hypothetical protein [Winslowiella arboricola]MCU5776219.1 hypothetical protein [Winslowiella arboricola]